MFVPLDAGILGFLVSALFVLLPVAAYIWLRYIGVLGDASGRSMR